MIWNLGSINADLAYSVPHLPGAGETLAATDLVRGLGGKGANMSVAAARAGARVVHVGAVGADGAWALGRLRDYGVDTRGIVTVAAPTGHAIILLEPGGENQIVIHPGANRAIPVGHPAAVLAEARPGDWLMLQNETSLQQETAALARRRGLCVAYAAAPFDAGAVAALDGLVDLLVLNAVEADQLAAASGKAPQDMGVQHVVVTRGADGAVWHGPDGARDVPAMPVRAVDTTGAGDTFMGFLVAGLETGLAMPEALELAARAAAVMVTRVGTADVIPTRAEVDAAR